ncbi:uncharacterized protein N7482_005709 [Penicillium canariense]|uniref:DUF4211 domain-containing protein n=1 Tax=Penicillium canariense TaxID=189055 RepID=A0A9W9LNQ1_9EURO|nr:uncharacterized protein N7482_005709 [Penicillium canariense]KAJ5166928.1 hypothetical protein N7482_005709 [Penicillium canariense]
MPRKALKKQTRLAFAPKAASSSGYSNDEGNDRFARLSYGHPDMATMRPKIPRKSMSACPPAQESSSATTTSRRNGSPVIQNKKERKEKKKKDKEKKEGKKDKLKVEEENLAQSVQNDQEGSSDDEIIIPGSQKRARRAAADIEFAVMNPFKSTQQPQPPSGSPENAMYIADSDEEEEISRPRRRLKRKAEHSPVMLSDSEDSEEPKASSPSKRRRLASDTETPQTPRPSADQNQQDIEDDVRDLQDSVVKKTRTRGRAVESARDKRLKHLETLRRRRAGQKEESENESESEVEPPQSSPTQHVFNIRRNDEEDSDVESAIAANEDLDRYEDDFVLEDTEFGVPTEEIPFEFTRHAYKKPKEYFRDVVAWMVHNRIDPAFPRDDTMYQMAFQKLGDEVKGRAGSSLISSVWSARFRQVLLARPDLEVTAFPTEAMHSCDACNRAGHPASSDLKFSGKAYSEDTFEPLTDDSSEDDPSDNQSDESGVERDRDGHILPDEKTHFYLGKTCKANAFMAHLLTHWRYRLNEWVVDYLRLTGQMDDSEVLRRNNLSQKRKTRNALEVIDKMAAAGEIDKLYRDFHMHLKDARLKTSTMEE